MKIIRLSTFLDYGGIEKKMENLSSYDDIENEWIFYSIGKGGVAEKKINFNNKKTICLNRPYKIISFGTILALYKLFKTNKPDVVHTSGAEANFHGIIAAKMAKVPRVIAEEIGISNYSFLAKIIFNIIYYLADFVVGESIAVVSHLRREFKYINPIVIHNFILDNKLEDLNRKYYTEKRIFKIISVSRVEKVKNIEGIIKALKVLLVEKGYNVEFTIVGDGTNLNKIKEMSKELGINKFIKFTGFLDNPNKILINYDLYILNSFSEGFSNSLLEAMINQVPVLSTNVGGAPEFIEDGVNGWLVEVNNQEQLVSKLERIIGLSNKERSCIAKNGRETVRVKYSLTEHINKLLKIYRIK